MTGRTPGRKSFAITIVIGKDVPSHLIADTPAPGGLTFSQFFASLKVTCLLVEVKVTFPALLTPSTFVAVMVTALLLPATNGPSGTVVNAAMPEPTVNCRVAG